VNLSDKDSQFIIHLYFNPIKKLLKVLNQNYGIACIFYVARCGNKYNSALTQSLETDMPCVRQNYKPHQSSHDEVVHQHKHNHAREVLPCTVTYCVNVGILLVSFNAQVTQNPYHLPQSPTLL
jgi:hypothetical protein